MTMLAIDTEYLQKTLDKLLSIPAPLATQIRLSAL